MFYEGFIERTGPNPVPCNDLVLINVGAQVNFDPVIIPPAPPPVVQTRYLYLPNPQIVPTGGITLIERDIQMTRLVGEKVVNGVQRPNEAIFHNAWCHYLDHKEVSPVRSCKVCFAGI